MAKEKQTTELESILERGKRIGDYVIYTDSYNFIVARVAIAEKGDNIGREYACEPTFHSTLKQAIDRILTDHQRDYIKDLSVVLKKHDEVLQRLDNLTELKRQSNPKVGRAKK